MQSGGRKLEEGGEAMKSWVHVRGKGQEVTEMEDMETTEGRRIEENTKSALDTNC